MRYSKPTLRYKTRLLRTEIERQKTKLKKLEQQRSDISKLLFSQISFILSIRVRKSLDKKTKHVCDTTTFCYDKKFSKL